MVEYATTADGAGDGSERTREITMVGKPVSSSTRRTQESSVDEVVGQEREQNQHRSSPKEDLHGVISGNSGTLDQDPKPMKESKYRAGFEDQDEDLQVREFLCLFS